MRAVNIYRHTGRHGVTRPGGEYLVRPPASDKRLGDVAAIALLIQVHYCLRVRSNEPHAPVTCLPLSFIQKSQPKDDLPPIAVWDNLQEVLSRVPADERQVKPKQGDCSGASNTRHVCG